MGYVSILVVRRSYRGQHLGIRLLDKFIEIASKKKMSTISLYTHETNKAAISIYKKYGFIQSGLTRGNDYQFVEYLK